ncbi:MAG: trigger factor [Cyanobacteriota bacterium]
MKVTQEKLPASQVGLEIEIPADKTKQTYEKVLKDLTRTANIPGFRQGKVPRQILLQRLGKQRIKAAVLEELVQDSLREAIEQESVEAIGNYELRTSFEELIQNYEPGEPLTFSATVDVPPEVKLGDYKNLSIKAEETAYDSTQVDNFLEERRREQATLIPVESRPAQMGDVTVVDYEGRFGEGEEAQPIEGAQATDFQLELGEGRFLAELVNGIVGMNVGETKEISVSFPEDYAREDLAGNTAKFTVTLKELKEKELPALDDDFAQEVSEYETLAELRESLEKQFKERAEQETKTSIHEAIVQQLVEQSDVDLPESMIEREVETILTQTAMQMSQYGMDIKQLFTPETVPQMKQRSRPEAIQRLQQSLILTEIAKQESLEPDEAAVKERIEQVMEQLEGQAVDQTRVQEVVKDDLRREKALDFLQEHAQVELVEKGTLQPETETETEVETEEAATTANEEEITEQSAEQ